MSDFEVVQVDHGCCVVQRIAGDGNCLFGAIAHQIFQYDVRSTMHGAMTRTLREMAVEYLHTNFANEDIRTLIQLRVNDEFPSVKENDEFVTYTNFLSILHMDGVFGASESLLALAAVFNCQIKIMRENGYSTTVVSTENHANLRIQIVYRGNVNDWNHYDSFVKYTGSDNDNMSTQRDEPHQVNWWDRVTAKNGICLALKTPMDGNCLFSAIAHQLFGAEIGSPSHIEHTMDLRRQIVAYIRLHAQDKRMRVLLEHRIEEYSPRMTKPYADAAYGQVLDRLSQPGVWAGAETLMSVAELFRCVVRTVWEDGPMTSIAPQRHDHVRMVTVVLRKSGQCWNHYDSFICFETMRCERDVHGNDSSATGVIDLCSDVDSPGRPERAVSTDTQGTVALSSVQMDSVDSQTRSMTSGGQMQWPQFKVGTWNVRGINDSNKRKSVDEYLSIYEFGIVALQETKLVSRTCDTRHYKWILGRYNDKNGSMRTARRLAFLIHKTLMPFVKKTYQVSDNVLAIEVVHDGSKLLIVNVHLPQITPSADDFRVLQNFIVSQSGTAMIVMGDFNAHLGRKDLTDADKFFIGSNLYHDDCNDNGEELKALVHMGCFSVKNTWCRSPSVRTTWTSQYSSSQVDHMLCNSQDIRFSHIHGTWVRTVKTDHALLSAEIYMQSLAGTPRKRKRERDYEPDKRLKSEAAIKWDVTRLHDEQLLLRYQCDTEIGANAMIELESAQPEFPHATPAELWAKISNLIKKIAQTTIPATREPLSPRTAKANEDYHNARRKLRMHPSDAAKLKRVHQTKSRLEEVIQLHKDEECSRFFNGLQSTHPRVSTEARPTQQ